MKKGRVVVFVLIGLLFLVQLLDAAWAASQAGETAMRPEMLAAQVLVLLLPIRGVGKNGEKIYSAMLYRVISGPGGRKVQFYPKNFKPLDQ